MSGVKTMDKTKETDSYGSMFQRDLLHRRQRSIFAKISPQASEGSVEIAFLQKIKRNIVYYNYITIQKQPPNIFAWVGARIKCIIKPGGFIKNTVRIEFISNMLADTIIRFFYCINMFLRFFIFRRCN